jgi:hypothetical protein
VLLFRSNDENSESLLPPPPQTEDECTTREVSSEQLSNPSYRNKLESEIESVDDEIEIIDGFIVRCMPDCMRKCDASSVFQYGNWADDQGDAFAVGKGGFTFGNTMSAPDAYFHLAGNMPPSTQRLLTPTVHPPNLIIETEHEGRCGKALEKITNFWFQNGVQEAWLLVIPDIEDVVPHAPVGAPPPVPLPVVQMIQVRPAAAPFIAIYIEANNPQLLGYFPIDWHTEFQPPPESLLFCAPSINCDRFMRRLC